MSNEKRKSNIIWYVVGAFSLGFVLAFLFFEVVVVLFL